MKWNAHKISSIDCKEDECYYYHSRCLNKKCNFCPDGILHAFDADWSDYSFGHAGGPVYFKLICDKCNSIIDYMG